MHESEATTAGRQAFREVVGAVAFAVALLGVLLIVALVSGHATTAYAAALAFVIALVVSGVVFRRVRRVVALRSDTIEQERQGREQLDRTLAASRQLFALDSPLDVRRQICEVAREVFGCSGVSLWEVGSDEIVLLERVPWIHPYTGADRRPIAELPGLREALDRGEPLWVDDLRERASGLTRATAEILGTGSLLNVPV